MEEARIRRVLDGIFDACVEAAHPQAILPAHLPELPAGRVVVLAAGKAAASMAAAAVTHYDRGLEPGRVVGIAVTRDGYALPAGPIRVVEAGHPLPNEAGLAATRAVLELAAGAGPDDLVLALISGGGSANWLAPAPGVSLADKQAVTKALLRSGAGIDEINCVRKHLSQIKGGRLAAAARAGGARLVTLAISDVPGDDPSVIASGPTVPDATTLADARAIIERRGIALPESCRAALDDPANESPKPGDAAFEGAAFTIVATPAEALAAAERAARAAGYEVLNLGADVEGEARDVAAEHARLALAAKARGEALAILSGGELTVTIRGEGKGGPNQEYALALAVALDGAGGIAALSGDTDGTDGGTGLATDPAGAFVLPSTLQRARAAGIDPAAALADNDSTGFFAAIGDLLQPGPTHTNVNDCRVILVG